MYRKVELYRHKREEREFRAVNSGKELFIIKFLNEDYLYVSDSNFPERFTGHINSATRFIKPPKRKQIMNVSEITDDFTYAEVANCFLVGDTYITEHGEHLARIVPLKEEEKRISRIPFNEDEKLEELNF